MKRENERGFALLLVFVLAAALAISLYKAMPRAAFESERNKEELLIERGEQYTRAVQLFVGKFKRFPANMDELEKTNNIRFLRKKYVDPMTGKDEWRLLHVNALGILIDSKIKKKDKDRSGAVNDYISLAPTIDQGTSSNNAAANLAMRRRPSEQQGIPGQPVDPNAPPAPYDPNNPSGQNAGRFPGQVNVLPNTAQAGQPYPGQPYPGQTQQGYTPGYGQSQQSQQGYPVNPATPDGRPQGTVGNGFGNSSFGSSGFGSSGFGSSGSGNSGFGNSSFGNQQTNAGGLQGGQNTAMGLIQSLLTSPSQMGPQMGTGTAGAITAGGIAGVASKFEGDTIKIYNDRHKYEEWEFIYDMKKDKRLQQAIPGVGAVNPGNSQGGSTLQTGGVGGIGGQQSSFGTQPASGFGQQNGGGLFGSQSGGFGQPTPGNQSNSSSASGPISVAPGIGNSTSAPQQPAPKIPPAVPATQQTPTQANPTQPAPTAAPQTSPQQTTPGQATPQPVPPPPPPQND